MYRSHKMLYPIILFAVVLFPVLTNASSFKHVVENSGLSLKIEQAYAEDGSSKPKVSINGALLRQFSLKQKLTLVVKGELTESENFALIHHWDGGNGCAGHLTLFSLSKAGFYQSANLGDCTEDYEVNLINDDGSDILEIKTFRDDTKDIKTGHWHYFDGNMVSK